MTLLAYRYALDPTPAQERALRCHAGAARVAFNWALALVKANLSQREAERSYDLAEDDLTPSISWSLYWLRKAWNAARDNVAPWWPECSKEAFNTGLDALARALKNWGDSRRGERKGKPVGFPRFRSRRRSRLSVRFTTGVIRCEARYAVLPRLGRIRRQLTDKTTWHGGTLIVADRWFASSKTCSQCGAVKAKLALSERTYRCEACGTVLDRDVNAAANLARPAASGADNNRRGADRKTGLARQVAVKRQPGRTVPTVHEAGTVPTQDGTAA